MSLTKVFLLIILHFLAYSLFLYVNAFLWKPIFLMGSFKKKLQRETTKFARHGNQNQA
jgi:hypothetical protein